ncbi:MAG TPA: tetratricopeptide repeat protein [Burkholderiales bacterium]|jgi:tetratricopeptide (TPR) repeat protein|nr:tetratricopeptide repeat protein [Burkholderiales bacterium]
MIFVSPRSNILVFAFFLLVGASGAFPEAPKSRQEALAQLANSETTARLEAIVWLANHGGMADTARLDALLRDDNALVRGYAEQGLWALWSRSGDADIDALMARGVEQMDAQDYKAAIATFSDIVRRKPQFTEGWNKRATVYYLAGEYRKSIVDCAEVLKRNPRHFGALSGLGLIYTRLERYDDALAWSRKALDVNPNMLGVEMNIKSIERLLAEKRGKQI